jgi:hypothetical protein
VLARVDEITCSTLSKLLQQQQQQAVSPQVCPRCHQALLPQSAQGRSLQSLRGSLAFQCDVFHCEACRLDFFPSVPNSGV